jgi:hypothetical protein
MIERADGRDTLDAGAGAGALAPWAAGPDFDGAGACGACALNAEPAETTAASPTTARPADTTRPCRNIEMRMFENSVKKGGRSDLIKGKGKREKAKRDKEGYFFVILVTAPST